MTNEEASLCDERTWLWEDLMESSSPGSYHNHPPTTRTMKKNNTGRIGEGKDGTVFVFSPWYLSLPQGLFFNCYYYYLLTTWLSNCVVHWRVQLTSIQSLSPAVSLSVTASLHCRNRGTRKKSNSMAENVPLGVLAEQPAGRD